MYSHTHTSSENSSECIHRCHTTLTQLVNVFTHAATECIYILTQLLNVFTCTVSHSLSWWMYLPTHTSSENSSECIHRCRTTLAQLVNVFTHAATLHTHSATEYIHRYRITLTQPMTVFTHSHSYWMYTQVPYHTHSVNVFAHSLSHWMYSQTHSATGSECIHTLTQLVNVFTHSLS